MQVYAGFGQKGPFKANNNTLQGRVVEFAPGEQSNDRSTLHSVCGNHMFGGVKTLRLQARSHSPTKFRPLTSAGVSK